jgi:hypothetical protein
MSKNPNTEEIRVLVTYVTTIKVTDKDPAHRRDMAESIAGSRLTKHIGCTKLHCHSLD